MNKSRKVRWVVSVSLLVLVCLLAWGGLSREPQDLVQAQVIGMRSRPMTGDYERAVGPRELVFPRDHGPHPDFQTEWWYYTGNLETEDGQRFGYQLTFFRRALQPAAQRSQRPSDWAAEQVYMAHLTVTDVNGKTFQAFERFERGAAGLAGAAGEPAYKVWVRDWSVQQTGQDIYQLHASDGALTLDLRLVDQKGPVLQGDHGYSQKGPETGNASLYYSQTRLQSDGTLQLGGTTYAVSGLSWLDREISTSALSKDQVGWDWFALQLDDGSELMAYVLRRSDGTIDAFSSGTYILPDGTTLALGREDFEVQPEGTWTSPHSGGKYPARWTVRVAEIDLELQVEPLLADQELNLSFTYWEGAVKVNGTHAGQTVSGSGYVELTGYVQSLEDSL
jgi:predicted secreted hydrolase